MTDVTKITDADIQAMEHGLKMAELAFGFFPEMVGAIEALVKLADLGGLSDDADVVLARDLLARLEAAFPDHPAP